MHFCNLTLPLQPHGHIPKVTALPPCTALYLLHPSLCGVISLLLWQSDLIASCLKSVTASPLSIMPSTEETLNRFERVKERSNKITLKYIQWTIYWPFVLSPFSIFPTWPHTFLPFTFHTLAIIKSFMVAGISLLALDMLSPFSETFTYWRLPEKVRWSFSSNRVWRNLHSST